MNNIVKSHLLLEHIREGVLASLGSHVIQALDADGVVLAAFLRQASQSLVDALDTSLTCGK
ncbi:MAG: hypothetical protein VXZ13_17285 [Pseudomonadota bacterium]|nr:hypothetical protein [Pseudomonadota bacterium]